MNGITGESGTCNSPFAYPIARPSAGTASPLYTLFMQVFSQGIAAKPDADTWTAPRPATELGTIPQRTNQEKPRRQFGRCKISACKNFPQPIESVRIECLGLISQFEEMTS